MVTPRSTHMPLHTFMSLYFWGHHGADESLQRVTCQKKKLSEPAESWTYCLNWLCLQTSFGQIFVPITQREDKCLWSEGEGSRRHTKKKTETQWNTVTEIRTNTWMTLSRSGTGAQLNLVYELNWFALQMSNYESTMLLLDWTAMRQCLKMSRSHVKWHGPNTKAWRKIAGLLLSKLCWLWEITPLVSQPGSRTKCMSIKGVEEDSVTKRR